MFRIGYKHHILLIAFHPEIVCLFISGFQATLSRIKVCWTRSSILFK
jgi:hypothetical protein